MARGKPYDAIIIGGGHNGLTCACYLAAAGFRVRVLERRATVGGAAVSEEFYPGFRNSAAAHALGWLHPKIARELRLAEHGLRVVERPLAHFLPLSEREYLRLPLEPEAAQREIARVSPRDAERLPAYRARLERAGALLRDLLLETPPQLGGGLRGALAALRVLRRVRAHEKAARDALLECLGKSAGELLDAWFESDAVKAALGFPAALGHYASPYAPGTAYPLLQHAVAEVNGRRGAWGHALGGMGAVTQAMAAEAERRGVAISTECEVAKVCVDSRGAQGVQLSDGRVMEARCVVANVNPRTLFLEMLDARVLDGDFLYRIRGYRCGSATLRINVALAELPDFSCLPGRACAPHHQAGIVIAPSLAYMERAYFDARTFGCSRAPVIEMLIPSTLDPTLAPPGRHVASLLCQHFPLELPDSLHWDAIREDAADFVIETVARYAPNFRGAILGRKILTPLDLEREYGLPAGDIHHGALVPGQLWWARPVPGCAGYRAPVKGLYLCGAGTHPGGGVSGVPGHNAAREIVRDLRAGRFGRAR
jgi:phytoene dehydrogenase-like protein